MKQLSTFEDILGYLRLRGARSVVAVAWPEDEVTRQAVARAIEAGFASAIMVGCRQAVEADPDLMQYAGLVTVVDADNHDDACAKAVELARTGAAQVVMKGLVNTDNLLRAVLNKEHGLLPQGRVLTHITLAHIPSYNKLLLFTDPAVIPYPTDAQRHEQVRYIIEKARKLHIDEPRVSLIHCSEKVDERHFPFTADYLTIKEMAAQGEFGPCRVDGPLDVKTSCSAAALKKKHMESTLEGQADALVFPDIEAGNAFYKTITLFADAQAAGTLAGTTVPVVLPSRGDSVTSKFFSLAFASL